MAVVFEPKMRSRLCIRSRAPVRELTSTSSAFSVPETTLSRATCPT